MDETNEQLQPWVRQSWVRGVSEKTKIKETSQDSVPINPTELVGKIVFWEESRKFLSR